MPYSLCGAVSQASYARRICPKKDQAAQKRGLKPKKTPRGK
jgi:hypothetical protein